MKMNRTKYLNIMFRIIYFTFGTRILFYLQVYGYVLYFFFFSSIIL